MRHDVGGQHELKLFLALPFLQILFLFGNVAIKEPNRLIGIVDCVTYQSDLAGTIAYNHSLGLSVLDCLSGSGQRPRTKRNNGRICRNRLLTAVVCFHDDSIVREGYHLRL